MIAQTIQLALAPVFVLVAVGGIMNILTARLGRIVDRSRELLSRYHQTDGEEHDDVVREMRSADRRIGLIGQALRLLVLSSLVTGLTVVLLFIEEFTGFTIDAVVAGSFVLAIALLMWALVLFLRETQLAADALRLPRAVLEEDRKL
ncbi:DUF2721 domain-containing protein [Aurantiacibacter gangjinensis]|uniref:Uncharacterized protein n=1 Tax=Aurantiacibacter gangjinensis TaxID=502682 RepID=A0A0G9MM41_9SPHN|nr:DUF2721 domain-containing protein [Aurantiacibacter gangjinensis]APE27817.1 hypothetical protein BMF35_a0988 [Aurantiacibacter gangjinensis]KLE31801.1 hypothetical protein AAW01_09915 [Aurantiacibacter gangjinensis]